ncbi:hypothetical protein H8S95_07205 [Pontibacter sp. KCTC 32443]|uniref:hypothetical protein n=1 Tax=Pontibacter TaxID=323449 RepID=UPI00164E90E4|nr:MULTISPECIES: hypothetical protein [Pontibacter]MBC5773845.1 hypothetical protein [Pontibacter sp. KCTC 32443]
MKGILIIILVTISLYSCKKEDVFNPVFTGNVELKSQQEVDAFAAKGYTEINGSLTIGAMSETDITNLQGLKSLTKVSDELSILRNINLASLDGLHNIATVGSRLFVYQNTTLKNLDGLNGLSSVGSLQPDKNRRGITIDMNPALLNVDGLANAVLEGGSLFVEENASLVNLDGLGNISGAIVELIISENNDLVSITGLEGITSASGGWFTISNNPKLTSLAGLENIRTIGGHVKLMSNDAITDLQGLNGVTEIGGGLEIYGNDALASIKELGNLTSIGHNPMMGNSRLIITANGPLVTIDGLEKLKALNGFLEIGWNKSLRNFCAIKGLLENEELVEEGEFKDYIVNGNAYNPTIQNILNGNCFR